MYLKDYLNFRIAFKGYEAELAIVNKDTKDLHENFSMMNSINLMLLKKHMKNMRGGCGSQYLVYLKNNFSLIFVYPRENTRNMDN